MRLTRAQNVLRLAGNVQNRVDFWGFAPDPAEGAYDAPSDSLVVRASCLRQSQLRAFGACNFPYWGGIASITQGGDRRHCYVVVYCIWTIIYCLSQHEP